MADKASLAPIRFPAGRVLEGMRVVRPAQRVAGESERSDWEREWQTAEAVERQERPHGRPAAAAVAATAGGSATAYGAWAGDLGPGAQIAAAAIVSVWALAVVPVALGGARSRVHFVVVTSALLSAGAGAIHFAVIQSHFEEWWGYGVFFVASGIAQLAWSLLIVAHPTRWLFWLGVLGNAAIVALWVVTRTVGTIVGPAASEPEAVGLADVTATAFEGAIIVGALLVVRRGLPGRNALGAVGWAVGLAVLGLTTVSLLSADGAASGLIPPTG